MGRLVEAGLEVIEILSEYLLLCILSGGKVGVASYDLSLGDLRGSLDRGILRRRSNIL